MSSFAELVTPVERVEGTAEREMHPFEPIPGKVESIEGKTELECQLRNPATGETLVLKGKDAEIARAAIQGDIATAAALGKSQAQAATLKAESDNGAATSEISAEAVEAEAIDRVRVACFGFARGEFQTHAQYLASREAISRLEDAEIMRETLLIALDTIRRQDPRAP